MQPSSFKQRFWYQTTNFSVSLCLFFGLCSTLLAQSIPHLKSVGDRTQLIVDDKPFLILGGELGNSTFTSVENMKDVWPKLTAMNLNTVLAPVYWELIEPQQGTFDFELLGQLIEEARRHDLRLVLLWFGSWKNSMSSHAPAWVKLDQATYPRAKSEAGVSQEILTPFSPANARADREAYVALMNFLKVFDGIEQTVIMVQPENEIGMLPSARDYHPLANAAFTAPVPEGLMSYKDVLIPEFRAHWQKTGFRESGTWEEVFGKGLYTDEIFMAWYYATFTEEVTKAGKAVYPLPMFVNAALATRGRKPGEYPSAGPLPHLMDVWKAGAPSIDFLSPDFYNPNFEMWNDLYVRQGNPLFIPEHKFDNTVAGKAAFAIGHYEALGFAPFSIESTEDAANEPIGKMYRLLDNLSPVLAKAGGLNRIEGVLLDKESESKVFQLGDYEFTVNHSYKLGWEAEAKNENWDMAGAVIVYDEDGSFYVAGNGYYITFTSLKDPSRRVGILKADEGHFVDGKWTVLRHLNGDQTHQGRHIRMFKEAYKLQRFELYTYE